MPEALFELGNRGYRGHAFVRYQLPFLVAVIVVLACTAVGAPELLARPFMVLAYALLVVASVVHALVPWRRHGLWAALPIALADIVAVALLRAELMAVVPASGMLAVFPALWLSYAFPSAAVSVAIGGALLITTFPFLLSGSLPSTPLEWVSVASLPALIVIVSIGANVAARVLRAHADRLATASAEQAATLRLAIDDELVLRKILDTVDAAVVFYDEDQRLSIANEPAKRMATMMELQLDRPPFTAGFVLAPDRSTPVPPDQQIIPRALRGDHVDKLIQWVGPADNQIAFTATSGQVRRPDGTLIGTVIAAHDVTELANAVEVREEFLRTVSHELRTPIANVTGYLDLLEEALPDDAHAHRHLAAVQRNVERLTDRVRELQAAVDSDVPLRVQPTDLHALVADAVEHVTPAATVRGIALTHVGDVSARADVDRSRIRQVVEELLTNAVKFSPDGATVIVEQRSADDAVEVSVTDAGPGLSRGEQTRVFDRFYRAPFARHNAIPGFGLGLALVRSVVTAHRGKVTLDSLDRGMIVTVHLPTH